MFLLKSVEMREKSVSEVIVRIRQDKERYELLNKIIDVELNLSPIASKDNSHLDRVDTESGNYKKVLSYYNHPINNYSSKVILSIPK